MRILHTEASCGWGGQEMRILAEAAGMLGRGHQVHLLCPAEAPICAQAPKRGVPVTALPIGKKKLAGVRAFRRWLQANPVDVINTHSSTDSWLAALACLGLPNRPAIVRTRHISAPVTDNLPTRWLYTSATAHIVTTGEALRRQLIVDNRYAPTLITSVPTGIALDRFHPADKTAARTALRLDTGARYLGIVATLRSWKGHHDLIAAFDQLNAPGWRLLIVGDGPQQESLRQEITQRGLQGRVMLAGQQEQPEHWMQAMDVFCLPSYANEGVPQALMQAMAVGLPIVTTPVGAIPEIIDDGRTGLIVTPRQPSELAAGLRRLMDDSVLARRLGDAALQEALARFGTDAMLDRMEKVFADAIARAKR